MRGNESLAGEETGWTAVRESRQRGAEWRSGAHSLPLSHTHIHIKALSHTLQDYVSSLPCVANIWEVSA